MLTSLGLSDPTSQWVLFLGGSMSLGGCRLLSCLEQHSLERGARLCDGKQPPGLGAGPGPGLLSVCVYLTPCHWSRGARPTPNKKDPQLCLRCSALGSPGSNHRVSVGLRGSLHDVPPCPAASPAQLPTHLARGAGAWPSCAPGATWAPAHLNPRPSGRLSQTMSEFFLTPNIFQSSNFIGSCP